MTVTVTVAVTVAVVVMVIRSRPWNTKFCFLAHSDSLPGAGSMSNKSASGFRRPARRFPARGWVLAEQTCIARGSPVQTKLACVEVPFPLRVLQDDGATRPSTNSRSLSGISLFQSVSLTFPRQWLGMEGRSPYVLGKYSIAWGLSAAPMGVYSSMIRPCQSTVTTSHPPRGCDTWTTLALPDHVAD